LQRAAIRQARESDQLLDEWLNAFVALSLRALPAEDGWGDDGWGDEEYAEVLPLRRPVR
jgi:hypothetical protein